MKLDSNGVIAKFYSWSNGRTYINYYGDIKRDLPDNFCRFFWGLLFAVLLFPFSLLSIPFAKITGTKEAGLVIRLLLSVFGTFFSFLALTLLATLVHHLYLEPEILLFILFVVVGAMVMVLISIGFFIVGKKGVRSEAAEIVSEKVKSFKDGYCPRIDWK